MAKIAWNGHERDVEQLSDLEQILDDLHARFTGTEPTAVVLELPQTGDSLAIVLGLDRSILNYVAGSKDPPYLTSVGVEDAHGVMEFRFMGDMSELPLRNAVPIQEARKAMRYSWSTGRLTPDIVWEED